MNIIKTEMLMIADNLESKADDARMDHDDVRMTPREVHELADDIKEFVRESDRPTCHDTEERVDSFTCSSCGFHEEKIMFNPFTYSFRTIKPNWKYCPNCGAVVTEKEEDDD